MRCNLVTTFTQDDVQNTLISSFKTQAQSEVYSYTYLLRHIVATESSIIYFGVFG